MPRSEWHRIRSSRVALDQPPTHPDVLGVTNLGDAVAVVATTWWQANAVLKTLSILHREEFRDPGNDRSHATELKTMTDRSTVAMAGEQALSNEAAGWIGARFSITLSTPAWSL